MPRLIVRMAWGLLVGVTLLVAVLVGSFLRPGVREFAANAAIRRADQTLPGVLKVAEIRWPTPGHVILHQPSWLTAAADTAFAAERIEVNVAMRPLWRRDLEVRRLEVTGVLADVAALQDLARTFAASAPVPRPESGSSAFPRTGAVPGIPSVALNDVRIQVAALREPGSETPATLDLAGSVDLLSGHVPRIDLRRLEAVDEARQIRVGSGEVRIDPANRIATGRIHAQWSRDWGFVLELDTPEPDRFLLLIREEGVDGDAVRADTRVLREGEEITGLTLEATIRSPTVARLVAVPGLEVALAPLPPDQRLELAMSGRWDFREGRARTDFRVAAFAVWDSLTAAVEYSPDGTSVPSFDLAGPGIRVSGDWYGTGYHAEAEITGVEWARPWAAGATLPDAVELRLSAVSAGTSAAAGPGVAAPASRLVLNGSVRQGDLAVDSVSVAVDGNLVEGPLTFELAARARDIWVQAAGAVTARAPWRIECVPLRIGESRGALLQDAPRGVVTLGERGDLRAEGLRVMGDFGQGSVRGDWIATEGGTLAAELLWPEAPPALLDALSDSPQIRDAVAARWKEAAAARVRVEGNAGPRAERWDARVRFQLPPPVVFGALLPDSLRIAGLAAPEGEVRLSGAGPNVSATLDAAAEGWWDALHAGMRSDGRGWAVDTLSATVLGVQADGRVSALASGDSLAGVVHVDVENLDRLRALAPELPPDLEAALAADIRLSGTVTAPSADMQASARAAATGWSAPAVVAGAEIRAGRLESARARAADSLRVGDFTFGRAEVEARPFGEAGFLASVSLQSDSLGVDAVASLEPTEAAGWLVVVDTLSTRWSERDLHTGVPFRLRWDAVRQIPTVENLELSGTLGSLSARGAWPESLQAQLVLKDPPLLLAGPRPAVWPSELRVEFGSSRPVTGGPGQALRIRAKIEADGLSFGPVRNGLFKATVTSVAQGDSLPTAVAFRLDDGNSAPVDGVLHLPHHWNEAARRVDGADGAWNTSVQLAGFPLPGRLGDPGAFPRFLSGEDATSSRFTGEIRISGDAIADSTGATTGRLNGDLTFPEQPRLRSHRLHAEADWNADGGLDAHATWFRADRSAAEVEASLPRARVATAAPFAPGDSLRSRVLLTDWILDDLNSLLPAGVKVEGRVLGDVSAEGPPEHPRLSGWFEAKELGFTSARGDRARAGGRLEFGGTADAPRVTGQIEVSRAVLRIPEPPRTLLPTSGDALLWPEPAAADSAGAPGAGPPGPRNGTRNGAAAAPVPDPVEALDLGIDLTFPRSCRITGRGLDVEMAGDLSLVLRGGLPRLEGSLRAVAGTFSFMGTSFTVDRGVATFYGTEDLDPDLDIELSHQKGDVLAIVRVTGRSTAPTITLTAEPAMEEADILAHLLFGTTGSGLDGEQTKFLESQAAAALRSFAIPGLERTVGRQLGLDVVQLGGGEVEGEGLSVTIGKYISPRALLKYDQGLGRPEDFSIHLVYWLSRRLRVETTTSRHTQSGVDLNWSSEY